MLLLALHISQDIVFGFDRAGLNHLVGVAILLVVVCGAVLLRERTSGKVIMLFGGVIAAGMLPLHMRNGLRPEFLEKSGALLFVWTLYVLAGSAVLMEIPSAMILASRLLPLRANRLANIIAGSIVTLVNGFLTFIPPLVGWGRPPALPEYLFFATIETVCTVVIVWQAWTWPGADAAVAPKLIVGQPAAGISAS